MKTLPIRWVTVAELRTKSRAICAELIHNGKQYQKVMIPPPGATTAMKWLMVSAITAEITNAARNQT